MSDLLSLSVTAVKRALEKGAEEAEVYANASQVTEVFLQNNDIKLGRSQRFTQIGIRVFSGRGLGFGSVNSEERSQVESAIDAAISLARTAPRDKANKLPNPQKVRSVRGLYDKASESFTPEQALDRASTLLKEAKAVDPRITVDSGQFTSSIGERAIATSTGVEAEEKASAFLWFIMGMATEGGEVSSFQYEFDGTHKVREIEVEKTAQAFGKKVVRSLGAKKAQSFKGTAIFSPGTVQEMLAENIMYAVDANNVQRELSPFRGKKGKAVAAKTLTVLDDGTLPGGLGSSAFDREGLPHRAFPIIQRGVLKNYLYNTYAANKERRRSTGSAVGDARTVPSIGPSNFIIPPGKETLEDLLENVKRGILVERLSAFPEPVSGNFSGVVKGGSYIENGELKHPVKETLLAGNMYEMMRKVTAVSKEQQKIYNYYVPYVVLEGGSVTSG